MQIPNLPFWNHRCRAVFVWCVALWSLWLLRTTVTNECHSPLMWSTCSFKCCYLKQIIWASLACGKAAFDLSCLKKQDKTTIAVEISWWHLTKIIFALSQRKCIVAREVLNKHISGLICNFMFDQNWVKSWIWLLTSVLPYRNVEYYIEM